MMNHLVKMFVKSSLTLYEFVGSLKTTMLGIRDKKMLKDHEDTFALLHLVSNLLIEASLLNRYTSEAFKIYQNIVRLSISYLIRPGINAMVQWKVISDFFTYIQLCYFANSEWIIFFSPRVVNMIRLYIFITKHWQRWYTQCEHVRCLAPNIYLPSFDMFLHIHMKERAVWLSSCEEVDAKS